MIVKVISFQIPKVWESVKYALDKVEGLDSNITPDRYNYILAALLNDTCQCFIRVDDEKEKIKALMLTEIYENAITKFKGLKVVCLYAFEVNSTDEWESDFKFLVDFAASANCKEIFFESRNSRVMDIARRVGFVEKSKVLSFSIRR